MRHAYTGEDVKTEKWKICSTKNQCMQVTNQTLMTLIKI